METSTIVLRLLHVGLGVFWGGAILFTALYLEPAVRGVGPVGGQVLNQLVKRRYFETMLAVALVTILTGIELLRRASTGFSATWMGSATGIAFSIGGLAAIVAFLTGILVSRPTQARLARLTGEMQAGDDATRTRLGPEVERLRTRFRAILRFVAVLMAISIVTMAIARYL